MEPSWGRCSGPRPAVPTSSSVRELLELLESPASCSLSDRGAPSINPSSLREGEGVWGRRSRGGSVDGSGPGGGVCRIEALSPRVGLPEKVNAWRWSLFKIKVAFCIVSLTSGILSLGKTHHTCCIEVWRTAKRNHRGYERNPDPNRNPTHPLGPAGGHGGGRSAADDEPSQPLVSRRKWFATGRAKSERSRWFSERLDSDVFYHHCTKYITSGGSPVKQPGCEGVQTVI